MCDTTGPFGVGALVCVAGEHSENPGGHKFAASYQPAKGDGEVQDD